MGGLGEELEQLPKTLPFDVPALNNSPALRP
jgi:hypothetical protein